MSGDFRPRAARFVLGIAFLSLVTNRIPEVTVGAFTAGALLSARRPDRAVLAIAGIWVFWLLSFAATAAALGLLASFDFHRRDGQVFFSMLPLAAFSWGAVDRRRLLELAGVFCAAQALLSLLACGSEAAGHREWLEGIVFIHDEDPATTNFGALYRAHNAAGSVLALCALLAAALAAFQEGKGPRWVWGLMTIPLLWGVILSKSRGAMVGLGVGLVVLSVLAIVRGRLSRRAVIGVGLVVLATAVAFGPGIVERFSALARTGGTHTARWEWWKRGLQEWTWSPIVGIGMGRYNDEERTFSGVKHVYYVATGGKVVNAPSHAHNSYVHFLAEGGIVGFGVTVGFWAWLAWKLRGSREPLRIAAFLGVLFLFAISLTEHYMGGGIMLMVLSSIVGAAWSLPEPPPPDKIAAS